MYAVKPNEKRAKTAIILIWIVMGLDVVSAVSGYFQYDLLKTVADGGEITTEAGNANDLREQVIAIIHIIAYIISAVTFIQWFRRAYYNLHQCVQPLLYTEGWAAGSWFVPILNLFRPYQIMKELYNETREIVAKKELSIYESFNSKAVGIWWTLWIVSSFLGQFVFRYSRRADTVDELMVSTIASIADNILGIPLAILAIKVIKDYAAVEPLLAEVNSTPDDTTSSNGDYLNTWAPAQGSGE